MAETPINLNKARKARARLAEKKTAAENRAKFGRAGAEKALDKTLRDKSKSQLDLHKRERGED